MALSQNTFKEIKILPKIHLFASKDGNAMLNSILVTTANGKPQIASSRLPFAVNAMLKVPNDINQLFHHTDFRSRLVVSRLHSNDAGVPGLLFRDFL